MKGMKNYYVGLIFLLISFVILPRSKAFAQESCSQNLEIARNLFDEGKYYEIRKTLSDCLASGFSRVESIEALELLALTEMYLDHQLSADSTYLALLRIDPEHTVDAADPPDLIFLHNSFKTKPLLLWIVEAGVNQVYPRVIYEYSVFPEFLGADSLITDIKHTSNFSAGAGLEIPVTTKLFLGLSAQFMRGGVDKKFNAKALTSNGTNHIRISWINIPVYARYQFGSSRLKPYVESGGILSFAVSSALISPERADKIFQDLTSGRKYNLNNVLVKINYSVMIGGGVIFKTSGISSLALDVSYRFGLLNYADESKRFSLEDNQEALITHNYVPDAARIDHMQISLKYLRPIYKPRKILPK